MDDVDEYGEPICPCETHAQLYAARRALEVLARPALRLVYSRDEAPRVLCHHGDDSIDPGCPQCHPARDEARVTKGGAP